MINLPDVTLFWVPGHWNVERNEQTDGLARRGSAPPVVLVCVPLATIGSRIYSYYLVAADFRCRSITICIKARRIWLIFKKTRLQELLYQTHTNTHKITAVYMGYHAARLDISQLEPSY